MEAVAEADPLLDPVPDESARGDEWASGDWAVGGAPTAPLGAAGAPHGPSAPATPAGPQAPAPQDAPADDTTVGSHALFTDHADPDSSG